LVYPFASYDLKLIFRTSVTWVVN